uniref:BZIP domain-containing protein n=1 Tax=Leersia perrieri TaxID=77586 RepID=A0A0D9XPC4_9ORYZ
MDPRFPPPSARGHHRRAHSETFIRLPDADLLLDPDGDFGFSDLDFPSLSDDSPAASDPTPPPLPPLQQQQSSSSAAPPPPRPVPGGGGGGGGHLRSLSLDAAFFDGLSFQGGGGGGIGHKRSGSMDGESSLFEGESAPPDYAKKAMPADRLAELSLLDPKRAKRILANRQSAARSKERKIKYTSELERKVQTLQTEATTLSTQLTLLQRDTSGLTAENRELKLRLQSMEEQAKLRDALNDALREEVQRLKIAAGQVPNMNGSSFNGVQQQQQMPSYFSQPQQMHYLSGHQGRQHHPNNPHNSFNGGQSMSGQTLNDSMDFIILGQENGNLVAIQEELMEENSLSDLLLAGAEAVEAGDPILASVVFSRLDDFLLSQIPENAAASSFDRLAYHFDQGLRSRVSSACTGCYQPEPPPSGNMVVHQIIQELSPFVKFAHFTTNQAILDATVGDMDVHVVDLNIGEGIQWSSFMSDLARRGGKSFILTAIMAYADCKDSTHDTAVRLLSEFASVLLGCVKKLQPKLVVIVEDDLVRIGRGAPPSSASFVDFFFEALHHFTMLFESFLSCFSYGNYEACVRLVETELVGPRIQDFVGEYRSVRIETNACKVLEGFKACELSACNIAQARMLVGLFNRVFGVVFEKGRLALCWKSRPLISVSVWAPDDRRRLEHILLRMHSVVEEAEGCHITNPGMLLLQGFIEGFYLGYYMLDEIKFQPPEEESIKDERRISAAKDSGRSSTQHEWKLLQRRSTAAADAVYFSQPQQMHYLSDHQGRHHHPNNPHNSFNGGQSMNGQALNDSMDFR